MLWQNSTMSEFAFETLWPTKLIVRFNGFPTDLCTGRANCGAAGAASVLLSRTRRRRSSSAIGQRILLSFKIYIRILSPRLTGPKPMCTYVHLVITTVKLVHRIAEMSSLHVLSIRGLPQLSLRMSATHPPSLNIQFYRANRTAQEDVLDT